MRKLVLSSLTVAAALAFGGTAWAQQGPPQYGDAGVNLEQATKAIEAAVAEAKKNGWFMAITVVSNSGELVHFSKMDQTQFGSINIAIRKAKAAAIFRRATKTWEDRVAQGGAGIGAMTLDGMIASEGGLPLMKDGKVIGGIGCSGATGAQDGQACKAGADTIK